MSEADDLLDRYTRAVAATRQTAAPALSSQQLLTTLSGLPEGHSSGQEKAALVQTVAAQTRLTSTEAFHVVDGAFDPQAPASTKAAVVSQAVNTALGGANCDVECSSPAMLKPLWRALFAGLLCIALGFCVDALYRADGSTQVSGAGLVAIAVAAAITVLGILVLVMGYGNVTIKGGTGSGSSAAK